MGKTSPSVARILASRKNEIIKIDLGCGEHKPEGFIGMDVRKLPGVDVVHDMEKTPWPFPDGCATLLSASHVVEHIDPRAFGFIKFMDEAWRVLKPEGQFRIATPYAGSTGYWSDPTHVNPCTHHTFHYFDPLQPTGLYKEYKPKPWKIEQLYWSPDGNMEVLLSKRREDPSYKK